jgi:hypothetical protein
MDPDPTKVEPTGICWCGCEAAVSEGSYFLPGPKDYTHHLAPGTRRTRAVTYSPITAHMGGFSVRV